MAISRNRHIDKMFKLTRSIKKRVGLLQGCHKTEKKMQRESSENLKRKRQLQAENNKELGSVSPLPLENKSIISDFDILSIYSDISKLSAIEEHLNLLYRPFTCFVKSRCNYKLYELECLLSNTRYEPHKHPALFIRHSNPSSSLRVYDNGNICSQGYSYDGSALGAKCFMNTMEQLGYSPMFYHPKFNVVNATFCMPFCINLDNFYLEYRRDCLYNPETHPYLIYKVPDSSIKLAIFPMGYVYVLLSSNPKSTQKVIGHILPLLYRHRNLELITERELSSGDINFKLLWENEFQKAYQDTLKYYMPKEQHQQQQRQLQLKL
ncbi:TATA-box-binding protein-like protein 1 [Drosophila innubila]|uniref:TATA-box-binding protein-like protein 1 n=1 Tax=Drosophila innubila TaxID=198719 RepID=UPI00148C5E9A|nr:TATA-box-binding protein-like protein 1 [Drosophila innubila]